MNNKYQKTFVVAICGATGVALSLRLLKHLLEKPFRIYLIISKAGYDVLKHEFGFDGCDVHSFLSSQGVGYHLNAILITCDNDDYFNSPASGSFLHDGMIIAPCSMKTLGAIANGINDNLICRAADVTLKERRPLVLVTRESPLNLVHIKNMMAAHEAGALIMPPVLQFYNGTDSIITMIDIFIGRIFNYLSIEHFLCKEWGQQDAIIT
ncbi:MAG TPA: UbiX family flavin prenyltransferase [Chitinispirillaceae bacterium]|nr:UbiX family flavin prenyltransferase [Chitinispirillaceae bacterium]